MAKGKQHQGVNPKRALVGRTSARRRPAASTAATRPPGRAGARPPKPARPIAAASPANIAGPLPTPLDDPEPDVVVASGAGTPGAGPGPGAAPAPAKGTGVEGLVAAREETHGDFDNQASVTQRIKLAIRAGKNWPVLSPGQTEALEQMASKIGRIVSGDADHPDHWDDIAGYAVLGRDAFR